MKRNIALVGLTALTVLVATTPAFAIGDARETIREVRNEASKTVENTSGKEVRTGETTQAIDDRIAGHEQRVEDRKAEFRAKLEDKAAERKTKLEGRRLAQCQNRQEKINALLGKSTEVGKRHLTNIQQFEARVTEFSHKKAIKTEAIQAALTDADEKEAAAVAVLDVMETQVFDCATLDGAKPADSVHTTREEKQAALRAYRDSVIAYLQAVKTAFAQTQSETEATEER